MWKTWTVRQGPINRPKDGPTTPCTCRDTRTLSKRCTRAFEFRSAYPLCLELLSSSLECLSPSLRWWNISWSIAVSDSMARCLSPLQWVEKENWTKRFFWQKHRNFHLIAYSAQIFGRQNGIITKDVLLVIPIDFTCLEIRYLMRFRYRCSTDECIISFCVRAVPEYTWRRVIARTKIFFARANIISLSLTRPWCRRRLADCQATKKSANQPNRIWSGFWKQSILGPLAPFLLPPPKCSTITRLPVISTHEIRSGRSFLKSYW